MSASQPPGDPTVDTTYTFCIYDRDQDGNLRLRYEQSASAGPDWRRTRVGWKYRKKTETGSLTVRAQLLARVRTRGGDPPVPSAADDTRHFDSYPSFGLVSTAGYCHLSSSGIAPDAYGVRANAPGHYYAHRRTFLD